MHILFVDESGTPPSPDKPKNKYFVIGGVIIPEDHWHTVRDALNGDKGAVSVARRAEVAILRAGQ
jgi:Protein of unknown function (DUF3800)